MNRSKRTTRRTFIKSAAAVAGAAVVVSMPGCAGPGVRRKPRYVIPSLTSPRLEKLRVAFIGTGGMGASHLESTQHLGITCPCYCDVDTARMQKAAELYPDARPYQDYRQMFDKEHKNFDAVMIAIPDHHHYPATVIAMQHGKHVYTQKPLAHTPWEARKLAEGAVKYKVATQMGNQGHAMEGWRQVYEWYHAGSLGQIKEVHVWTNRPSGWWPQGIDRPEGEDPVPANLDWDVWLGPAPVRPFKNGVYHPFVWRGWWDFGCGAIGDMACHIMDPANWSLGLSRAESFTVEVVTQEGMTAQTYPLKSIIK